MTYDKCQIIFNKWPNLFALLTDGFSALVYKYSLDKGQAQNLNKYHFDSHCHWKISGFKWQTTNGGRKVINITDI